MILNKAQIYHHTINLCGRNNNSAFAFSILREKLTELFADQAFVMKLSSITRIYPEYYSYKMLKLFLQSADSGKYLKYVGKVNKDKEKNMANSQDNNFIYF